MKEKAQLVLKRSVQRELLSYECSLCGQVFPLAEDRTAKQMMQELHAAFQEHVRREHVRASHPEDSTELP